MPAHQLPRAKDSRLYGAGADVQRFGNFLVRPLFDLEQHQRREHIAELRAEQQKIEAELQAVKEIAKDAEPMVVLENDSGTRVIMDLDSAIQPASLQTYD